MYLNTSSADGALISCQATQLSLTQRHLIMVAWTMPCHTFTSTKATLKEGQTAPPHTLHNSQMSA